MKKIAVFALTAFLIVSSFITAFKVDAVTSSSWSPMTPMPTARDFFGVAVVNGKIYAIGGWDEGLNRDFSQSQSGVLTYNVNEVYDTTSNTWTTKKPMPSAMINFAMVAYDTKIYIFAKGINYMYDTVADSWSLKTPSSTDRSTNMAAVVDGKIYLFGGSTPYLWESNPSYLTEMYDPNTDSWSSRASMPQYDSGFTAVCNGKIYIVGDSALLIYEPKTDSWSSGPAMPNPSVDLKGYPAYWQGAITEGAYPKIYLFGKIAETQIFDPETNTWSTAEAMPIVEQGFRVAAVNGFLYVIGGSIIDYYTHSGRIYESYKMSNLNYRYTPIFYLPTPSHGNTPTPAASPKNSPSPDNTGQSTVPTYNSPITVTIIVVIVAGVAIILAAVLLVFYKHSRAQNSQVPPYYPPL